MTEHLANERLLVEQAKQGDSDAFLTLASHYERNIFRLTLNITGNHEDAEDATQETFLKALANLQNFHGDSRFYTWIVRIAMNEALMKLRKHKTEKAISLDEPEITDDGGKPRELMAWVQNPEQQFARNELHQILREAMDKLPHAYRVVVTLRDVEQLSTQETAEILGMSIPAVKSRALRGRLMLREQLAKHFKRGMSYPLRRAGAKAVPMAVMKSGQRRIQHAEEALGALMHLVNAAPAA